MCVWVNMSSRKCHQPLVGIVKRVCVKVADEGKIFLSVEPILLFAHSPGDLVQTFHQDGGSCASILGQTWLDNTAKRVLVHSAVLSNGKWTKLVTSIDDDISALAFLGHYWLLHLSPLSSRHNWRHLWRIRLSRRVIQLICACVSAKLSIVSIHRHLSSASLTLWATVCFVL